MPAKALTKVGRWHPRWICLIERAESPHSPTNDIWVLVSSWPAFCSDTCHQDAALCPLLNSSHWLPVRDLGRAECSPGGGLAGAQRVLSRDRGSQARELTWCLEMPGHEPWAAVIALVLCDLHACGAWKIPPVLILLTLWYLSTHSCSKATFALKGKAKENNSFVLFCFSRQRVSIYGIHTQADTQNHFREPKPHYPILC